MDFAYELPAVPSAPAPTPAPGPIGLPVTGAELLRMLAVAGALVSAGALLRIVAGRRRSG
jgi:hypothetical protein